MGPRIVITGSTGLIGRNAVDHFAGLGYEILATDIVSPELPQHERWFARCDLLDEANLRRRFQEFDPDFVLHLGARTDIREKRSLAGYAANIDGVRNVIAAANACSKLRRLVITSSRLVCRIGYEPKHDQDYCPPNFYGASKVETERITRSSTIRCDWVLIRPTAIWGPGFKVPSYRDFFEQIRKGRYFHCGSTNPRKTFGYVKNYVYQMEKVLNAPPGTAHGCVLFAGDYEPVRVRDWADQISREFGRTRPIPSLPYGLLKGLAFLGDALARVGWGNVPLSSRRLTNLLCDSVHDCRPLAAITGPLPFDLESATRETVRWLIDNP